MKNLYKHDSVLNRLNIALAAGASIIALGAVAPAVAQDDGVDQIDDNGSADDFDSDDRIVVTGSRIRKDAFTSTSPLQVVDAETVADLGLIDIQGVLENTTVVQGVQLDQQFNSTFVSNAGPGGSAASLRGLGADRTLLLINGRRVAPAGVEGAPSFPDTSIIPSSMMQQIDILLDGASSVYGSDAIAGVINVVLRSEFEGLQLDAFRTVPEANSAGTEQRYSFMFGERGDRGGFVISAEYVHNEELNGGERDWMFNEVEGTTATGGTANSFIPGGTMVVGGPDYVDDGNGGLKRVFFDGQGGAEFIALGNFGPFLVTRPGTPNPAMLGGVTFPDFEFWDFTTGGLFGPGSLLDQNDQLLPEFQRFTLYTTADYDLDDVVPGMELFAEFSLTNRQTLSKGGFMQLDPQTLSDNPFNPFPAAGFDGPVTNRPFLPVRSRNDVELTQYRLITGLRGDLGFASLPDWDYEIFTGYTRSHGFSQRNGIREIAFLQSMASEDDGNGNIICSDVIPNPSGPFASVETLEGCIPFNPFDPGLVPGDGSDPQFLANNPAVLDFLVGTRNIDTFVDEAIISGYFTGPLLSLPAGDLQIVLGGEAREDALDTRADDSAARGLISGFFKDSPTTGDVHIWELFGEVNIPVFRDTAVGNLELEGAGRWTNHEFYGSNFTYSGKMNYQPVDFLTVKSTVGSSFRAPNLRELFLAGQTSFQTLSDPCQVPFTAQADTDMDGFVDSYNPGPNGENDGRLQRVLDNCQLEGVDPFSHGIGINFGSTELFNAGNIGLDPETSFAYSGGVTFEQPFTDAFNFRLSATYWSIKVEQAVFEPTPQQLVDTCYNSNDFLNDPFCTRRVRSPLEANQIIELDVTPFNIAEERASGIDINMNASKDFTIGGEVFNFEVDSVTTRQRRNNRDVTLEGATVFEENIGEFGSPKWRTTANARLNWNDFTLFYQVRHIGDQAAEPGARPTVCFDASNNIAFPVCYATGHTTYHDTSVSWRNETLTLRAGVQNLFDRDPPLTDLGVPGNDTFGVPIGAGFDRIGRRFFFNVTASL